MIKALQFAALLFTALTLSLTFSHLLEMPQKLQYGPELYMTVQHTLYLYFAWTGAVVEIGAVCSLVWLSVLLRRSAPLYRWTVASATCVALGLGVWFLLVVPANSQMAHWSGLPLPPNWKMVRQWWELGHAISAVLDLAGFVCLTGSVTIANGHGGRENAGL